MPDLLGGLFALLMVLFGLSVMIWGKEGPGKLMGAILAPFGCLLKIVAGIVVVVIGLVLLMGDDLKWPGPSPATPAPPRSPSGPPVGVEDFLLAQYPVLSQRDSAIYEPEGLADEQYWYGGQFQPVRNLACLATVYLMLRRGRGAAGAMITSASFTAAYDAINPGYVEQADIKFNGERFVNEIRAGRPVVLHAEGGLLGHHFLLGVGIRRRVDGGWTGIANDPWFGQRVELDLGQSAPLHPSLSDTKFTMMRLVN